MSQRFVFISSGYFKYKRIGKNTSDAYSRGLILLLFQGRNELRYAHRRAEIIKQFIVELFFDSVVAAGSRPLELADGRSPTRREGLRTHV